MKIYFIDRYLRQNKDGKNGEPGSYRLRFYYYKNKVFKASRIEFGLGTKDKEEARIRAFVFFKGLYALGYRIAGKGVLNNIKKNIPKKKDIYPPKEALQMELNLR